MADEANSRHDQDGSAQSPQNPFVDEAPTEIAPSAYTAPAGYESATQTAGPSHAQQNAQWAGYSSAGQHQSQPQGYATGPQPHYQTAPYGSMPAHSGAQMVAGPPKKKSITGWIIGIILALAAIAGFGLVWFFMPNKTSNTATTSPTSTKISSPAASNSSTSSSPTSSDVTGTIPAEANGTCRGSGTLPSNMRVVGDNTSCQYVSAIEGKIINAITEDPKTTEFGVTAYSNSVSHDVDLTCYRDEHISHCQGGNQVNLYVQDSIK